MYTKLLIECCIVMHHNHESWEIVKGMYHMYMPGYKKNLSLAWLELEMVKPSHNTVTYRIWIIMPTHLDVQINRYATVHVPYTDHVSEWLPSLEGIVLLCLSLTSSGVNNIILNELNWCHQTRDCPSLYCQSFLALQL